MTVGFLPRERNRRLGPSVKARQAQGAQSVGSCIGEIRLSGEPKSATFERCGALARRTRVGR